MKYSAKPKRKAPFYVKFKSGQRTDCVKFLENDCGLRWSNPFHGPPTSDYVISFKPHLRMGYVERYLLDDSKKFLNFITDRKELLYRLESYYGGQINISDLVMIKLTDKQEIMLDQALTYYGSEDSDDAEETTKFIHKVLSNGEYMYSQRDRLNQISKELKPYKAKKRKQLVNDLDEFKELTQQMWEKASLARPGKETEKYKELAQKMQSQLDKAMMLNPNPSTVVKTDKDMSEMSSAEIKQTIKESSLRSAELQQKQSDLQYEQNRKMLKANWESNMKKWATMDNNTKTKSDIFGDHAIDTQKKIWDIE